MRTAGWLTAVGAALIVLGWLSAAGYYACRRFYGCAPSELFVNVLGSVVVAGAALLLIAAPTIVYHLMRRR